MSLSPKHLRQCGRSEQPAEPVSSVCMYVPTLSFRFFDKFRFKTYAQKPIRICIINLTKKRQKKILQTRIIDQFVSEKIINISVIVASVNDVKKQSFKFKLWYLWHLMTHAMFHDLTHSSSKNTNSFILIST